MPNNTESLNLRRLLQILRRRFVLIALCAILVPAGALAVSLSQPKEYTASSSLLVRNPDLDRQLFGTVAPASGTAADPARDIATNLKLFKLRAVAQRTARALGGGVTAGQVSSEVEVNSDSSSNVATITVTDRSPTQAARIATTFAEQFILFRRSADKATISRARALVQRQLTSLSPAARTGPQGRALGKRIEDLQLLGAFQTGNVELVQAATPPGAPTSPKPVRNAAVGAVLGILLGGLLAILFELFDRRLRDPREVEELFERPILGAIPQSRALAKAGAKVPSLTGGEAEAFRMLRANLRYFNVDQNVQSVLITSAAPGDGKSTVAWNLAAAAAGTGARTVLIEADLRHPSLARAHQVSPAPGLSNILAGDAHLEDVIQKIDVQQGGNGRTPTRSLDVITAGPLPPNPTDLIESNQMENLIQAAEQSYDLVVIDTPPTSVVSDAIPLVNRVSGVIVVSRLGKSTRESVVHLRNQLRNLDAPTLGIVVNALGGGRDQYGYGYGYGYEDDSTELAAEPASPPTGPATATAWPTTPPPTNGPEARNAPDSIGGWQRVPADIAAPVSPSTNHVAGNAEARHQAAAGTAQRPPRARSGSFVRRLLGRR